MHDWSNKKMEEQIFQIKSTCKHDQGVTLTFQQLTSLVSCYTDYGVFILSIRKKELKSLLS